MAYPQLLTGSTVNYTDTSSALSKTITLAATYAAGDDIVVFWHCQDTGGGTTVNLATALSGGFSRLVNASVSGTTNKYAVFWRRADGTEGGQTFTISHSSGATIGRTSCTVYRVQGSHVSKPPVIAYIEKSHDAPSLLAPWGGGENLFLAYMNHLDSSAESFTSYPTGYSNGTNFRDPTLTLTAQATKQSAIATDDPATFVTSGGVTRIFSAVMVFGANPAPVVNSINNGNPIKAGQTSIPLSLSNFISMPTNIICSYVDNSTTKYLTVSNIQGNNTAVTADIEDRSEGVDYPLLGSNIAFNVSDGVGTAAISSTTALKTGETVVTFSKPINQSGTYFAKLLEDDGFTTLNGEFTYTSTNNFVLRNDSGWSSSDAGTISGWWRPAAGTGMGNVFYYNVEIQKTNKTINPFILKSTGKYSSDAASNGLTRTMPVIRADQFATGINGTFYAAPDQSNTFVSMTPVDIGGKSLNAVRFQYNANVQGNSLLAIGLDRIYTKLSFEYDWFIPSNFSRTNATNNKFFRLWNQLYTDIDTGISQKIGASMWGPTSTGLSTLKCDGGVLSGSWSVASRGTGNDGFVSSSDLGTWVHIKIDVVAPTQNGNTATNVGNGTIRIYKNGTLFAECLDIQAVGNGPQGFKNAYLMGWNNAPYATQTFFYIANLVIRGE